MARAFDLSARVADMRDDIEDNLQSDVPDAMDDTAEQVRQKAPEASGRLKSIHVGTEPAKPQTSATIAATKIEVPWFYKYPEYGTGARGGTAWPDDERFPAPSPIANPRRIQRWIEQKGITGNYYDETRDEDGGPSPLAWAIAEIQGEIGMEASPFMRPAWYGSPVGRQHVISEAESAASRAVRRL